MIDDSHLTKAEKIVLRAALIYYKNKLRKTVETSGRPEAIDDAKWRLYLANQLCDQIFDR